MDKYAAVVVYNSHKPAQEAVKALRNAGVDLRKLSVIGLDCCSINQSLNFCADAGEQKKLAELMSFWCRMWKLLRGDAILPIEGIGPVLVAGPLAHPILDAWMDLEAEEGTSTFRAGLSGLGLPDTEIADYEAALKAGGYLVILVDEDTEVSKARTLLNSGSWSSRRRASGNQAVRDGGISGSASPQMNSNTQPLNANGAHIS